MNELDQKRKGQTRSRNNWKYQSALHSNRRLSAARWTQIFRRVEKELWPSALRKWLRRKIINWGQTYWLKISQRLLNSSYVYFYRQKLISSFMVIAMRGAAHELVRLVDSVFKKVDNFLRNLEFVIDVITGSAWGVAKEWMSISPSLRNP